MNRPVPGYDRASVLDIAYICGGGVDCAMSLCEDNNMSLTDEIILGEEYSCARIDNVHVGNLKRINEDNVRPATALTADDMVACPYGGINFMGVDVDFIVS